MLAIGVTRPAAASDTEDTAPTASRGAARAKRGILAELTLKASSEISVYTDDDHVDVVTPTIAGSVESPTAGWSVGGRYLVDVVTAASADIIASASAPWTEVRHAASLEGEYKPGHWGVGAQASLSVEPDYRSLSAGAHGMLDLYDKNFTVLLGYAYGHDTAGRSSTPFGVFQRTLKRHALLAGLTAVLNRSTVATAIFDAIVERGDQSKPYRYVPMFEAGSASRVSLGADVAAVSALRLHARPLEALPLGRERIALTGRLAYRFAGATLRAEERLYIDTWGLKASTADLRYMFDVGGTVTLWPHVRLHLQSGADFWRRAYEVSRTDSGAVRFPEVRTGDRELGPLRTFVGGGGISVRLSPRWTADFQADGVFTKYLDALYLVHRRALFAAFSVHAAYD